MLFTKELSLEKEEKALEKEVKEVEKESRKDAKVRAPLFCSTSTPSHHSLYMAIPYHLLLFPFYFAKAARVEKSREAFYEYEAKKAAEEEARVRCIMCHVAVYHCHALDWLDCPCSMDH